MRIYQKNIKELTVDLTAAVSLWGKRATAIGKFTKQLGNAI